MGFYALPRLQAYLPLNPQAFPGVPPDLAFNIAVSFITNANWQAYGGETALSHLSQMVGLTTNNSSIPRRRPRSQSRSFALSRATNCRPSATSGSI
jgi:hypothetical protein